MWFGCALIPQTGLVVPVNALLYEHWMYLPSIGLFLGMAQAIAVTLENDRTRVRVVGAGCVVALALGVMTYRQNTVWHDPITFYTNIFNHGEPSWRAHSNLAGTYLGEGKYDEAMEQLQLALRNGGETAANVHENLSIVYWHRLQVEAEISELKRALELDPDYVNAADSLARVYSALGDKRNAEFYRQKAADIRSERGL
jgi:tetratricopeptide (TPR) repeat protein